MNFTLYSGWSLFIGPYGFQKKDNYYVACLQCAVIKIFLAYHILLYPEKIIFIHAFVVYLQNQRGLRFPVRINNPLAWLIPQRSAVIILY